MEEGVPDGSSPVTSLKQIGQDIGVEALASQDSQMRFFEPGKQP